MTNVNKLQYAGSVIWSVSIPDDLDAAWNSWPTVDVLAVGGTHYNLDGVTTGFSPPRQVTMTFYRGQEAEIDAMIETLQAIRECIAPPAWVEPPPGQDDLSF